MAQYTTATEAIVFTFVERQLLYWDAIVDFQDPPTINVLAQIWQSKFAAAPFLICMFVFDLPGVYPTVRGAFEIDSQAGLYACSLLLSTDAHLSYPRLAQDGTGTGTGVFAYMARGARVF
jgi:hypothetical protein